MGSRGSHDRNRPGAPGSPAAGFGAADLGAFDPGVFGPPGGAHGVGAPFVDPLQELLDAGIPGPGFGRLPGEIAPGELGPLRRERLEKKRKQREEAEQAARDARAARRAGGGARGARPAGPVVVENVDLVGAAGGDGTGSPGAAGGGARRRAPRERNKAASAVSIDLVASQETETPVSPSAHAGGGPHVRERWNARVPRRPAGGAGGDEVVDLT